MLTQPVPDYSFEDYLAREREAIDEKHEYVEGQVFAMTGASYAHNLSALGCDLSMRKLYALVPAATP